MGEGLTRASGGKLESILESLTKSKIKAVLLGAGVTAIIQSSSATTVMVRRLRQLRHHAALAGGGRHHGREHRHDGHQLDSFAEPGLQGDSLLLTLCKPATFTPGSGVYRRLSAALCQGRQEARRGQHHDRLCRADDRHGDDERRGQAAGGCAGVSGRPC